MCQAYTSAYVNAWDWLSKKQHNWWCVKEKEFSYWCSTCGDQKRWYKYKRPRTVDADAYGVAEVKTPKTEVKRAYH